MKKITSCILLAAMLVLQFSGCGAEEQETLSASNVGAPQEFDGTSPQEESGDLESEGVPDASGDLNLGGHDNSLDTYSAVVHTQLGMKNPVNALEGGGEKVFLGVSRAYRFKKHLYENVEECWDELSFVTAEGKTGSESFDRENQVWGVGPVAGTDHYVTFDLEVEKSEENYRYFLTERDENHDALREFPLDFMTGSVSDVLTCLSDFAVDCTSVIHLVWNTEEGRQYLLVSPEGEILEEYVSEEGYIEGLIPLRDGRVAFWFATNPDENNIEQRSMRYMDVETGRPVVLAAPENDVHMFTLLDESTMLYADQEGVYRSGLSGDHRELLYLWKNHGIMADEVVAIRAEEEDQIIIIYKDFGKYNYLCLKPTTEEVEIREITLAVSSYRKLALQPMVVEFNKQYPNRHIELKSDYDETVLLTELTAGKGPVLIDTMLTGFEEQEKLWEPLDTVMEQWGIMEELQPAAMELGKINGTLYGIVTDFSLATVVTGDPALKDWDYDTFLQCVEDRPELEAIINLYGGDYGTYFIMNFLSHGLDDSYVLDAEAGTTNFDSAEFRRVLEMAKKYCVREEAVKAGTTLLEGKVLCNELGIHKPEELALYRICYGEDVNYIGYPAKDGATHFIESVNRPLAVRRTATEEEKEIAADFIRLCLSYEGQSRAAQDINFCLSVRRDVLEEQIAAMKEYTVVTTPEFSEITLGDDLNVELDRATLLDMIEKARPRRYFPKELRNIMSEELEQYFSGIITEDMVINNLENRVGLYLEERN